MATFIYCLLSAMCSSIVTVFIMAALRMASKEDEDAGRLEFRPMGKINLSAILSEMDGGDPVEPLKTRHAITHADLAQMEQEARSKEENEETNQSGN